MATVSCIWWYPLFSPALKELIGLKLNWCLFKWGHQSVNAVYPFGLIFCEFCSLVAWGRWNLGSPTYPHSLYCDYSEDCEAYLGSLRTVMCIVMYTHSDITPQPLVKQKNKCYWANSYIYIVGSFSFFFSSTSQNQNAAILEINMLFSSIVVMSKYLIS